MSVTTEAEMIAHLNAAVVNKALQDPTFRAALLADPKAALEKALGTSLPPGVVLKAVEASPTEFTIVLPYQAKVGVDGELSDADLESVAGGSKSGATSFFVGTFGGKNDGSDAGSVGSGINSGFVNGAGGSNDGTQLGIAGQGAGIALKQMF